MKRLARLLLIFSLTLALISLVQPAYLSAQGGELPSDPPVIRAEYLGATLEGMPGTACWPRPDNAPLCTFVDDPQPESSISLSEGEALRFVIDPVTPAPATFTASLPDDTAQLPRDLVQSEGVFDSAGLKLGPNRVEVVAAYPAEPAGAQYFVSYWFLLQVEPAAAATEAATEAPTEAATEIATEIATEAATEAAATSEATEAATGAATAEATQAATEAALVAPTVEATAEATEAATATQAATTPATEAATQAATQAATEAATEAAAPTVTPIPPSTTPVPPSATPQPPTATPVPPTASFTPSPTAIPPTPTPEGPTATPTLFIPTLCPDGLPCPLTTPTWTPTGELPPATTFEPTAPVTPFAATVTPPLPTVQATMSELPPLSVLAQGVMYTPVAISGCLLTPNEPARCANGPVDAPRTSVVASPNDAAQVYFGGPRPSSVVANLFSGNGVTLQRSDRLAADNVALYTLPNLPGTYVLEFEVSWEGGSVTYFFRLSVTG